MFKSAVKLEKKDAAPAPYTLLNFEKVDRKKPIALYFTGSFNPPTPAHLMAIVNAAKELENQGYQIGKLYISPSQDIYVGTKHYPDIKVDSKDFQRPRMLATDRGTIFQSLLNKMKVEYSSDASILSLLNAVEISLFEANEAGFKRDPKKENFVDHHPLVDLFQKEHPGEQIVYVSGQDLHDNCCKWQKAHPQIVAPRNMEDDYSISSTKIMKGDDMVMPDVMKAYVFYYPMLIKMLLDNQFADIGGVLLTKFVKWIKQDLKFMAEVMKSEPLYYPTLIDILQEYEFSALAQSLLSLYNEQVRQDTLADENIDEKSLQNDNEPSMSVEVPVQVAELNNNNIIIIEQPKVVQEQKHSNQCAISAQIFDSKPYLQLQFTSKQERDYFFKALQDHARAFGLNTKDFFAASHPKDELRIILRPSKGRGSMGVYLSQSVSNQLNNTNPLKFSINLGDNQFRNFFINSFMLTKDQIEKPKKDEVGKDALYFHANVLPYSTDSVSQLEVAYNEDYVINAVEQTGKKCSIM